MKRQMMTAVAVCALAFAAGCASTSEPAAGAPGVEQTASTTPAPAVSGMRADYPITAEGATAFIADAEVLGVRVIWLTLGALAFPLLYLTGRLYVHLAEQAERDFMGLVDDDLSDTPEPGPP